MVHNGCELRVLVLYTPLKFKLLIKTMMPSIEYSTNVAKQLYLYFESFTYDHREYRKEAILLITLLPVPVLVAALQEVAE
jgi:hypothetical protein